MGRDKFQSRSVKVVFLGYPSNKKAYNLLDLYSHSIFYSLDVIFYEHVFPYHSSSFLSPPPSPPLNFDDFSPPASLPDPSPVVGSLPTLPFASPFSLVIVSPIPIISAPRRSSRPAHKPSHLSDYVCTSVSTNQIASPSELHI